MKPYYQDEWVAIYHGDCREILPTLEKVDLVLTDPPYGIGYNGGAYKKWNGEQQGWALIKNDDKQFNLEFLFQYPTQLIIWGANYFTNYIYGGSWIVWDKRTNENCDKMFGNPVELAWNSEGKLHKIYRIQHGGVVNADSSKGNNEKRVHPTQKPVVLFRRILEDCKNANLILDPFLGSGTTALASKLLNRKCIGIEIEERYCEIAAKRCSQSVMRLGV